MKTATALFLLVLCVLVYCLVSWKRNIDRVRHLNIPKVYNPLCPSNVVWLLIQPIVLPLLRLLPFSLGNWMKYASWGWEYEERYFTHADLGDVWMQVTPKMNWLYVADADLVNEIFHRREDFRRPIQLYTMLDIFGPNLGTVDGQDWQRHRKITGAAFNEQVYEIVWHESIRQADGMLAWWMSHGLDPIATTAKDVRTLSLNVLANAGFQKTYPFEGNLVQTNTDNKEATSFRNTLCFVLDNALLTMLVPARLLRLRFLPTKWKQVGKAIEELRHHMMVLYDEQKTNSTQHTQGPVNLMSSMVRASEQATCEAGDLAKELHSTYSAPKYAGLTVDEMFGNTFVYYFAGHDTTAAVFAYTVYLLAASPDVQDWIAEEIQHIMSMGDDSQMTYDQHFPQFKRCLAVLYETLRLYNPIPGLPKWTGDSDRLIQYKGQPLVIPARTFVLPSLMAVHTHPRHWGADSLSWRPSRWITHDACDGQSGIESESLIVPVKGTYFPWSDGKRNCPGKKFSQVEFVAVMATLFRNHTVAPELIAGETEQQARKRLLAIVDDSAVKMLLSMRDPSRVNMRWSKRRE